MLPDRTRRLELGKMLLDVSKYVLTIVVIGGLVFRPFDGGTLVFGFFLFCAIVFIATLMLPEEENKWDS